MANMTRVGAPKPGGGFYSADAGAPLPTDATTALDDAFQLTGLLSNDGLKESIDLKTEDIRDWSGANVRTAQSEYSLTLKLTFIERTTNTLKEVFGTDNVTETAAQGGGTNRTILYNEKMKPARSYVADMQDGKNQIRKVYPNAQVTDIGDIKYIMKDVVSYDVTIKAYKDDAGQFGYEYEFNAATGTSNSKPVVTSPPQ